MTLSSCNGQQRKTDVNNMVVNDTILLPKSHFKIVFADGNTLDIEITDTKLSECIKDAISPIFEIELNDEVVIAKGNNILSSSVPNNCKFFYPLNNEKKVVLHNNQINFRKISVPD